MGSPCHFRLVARKNGDARYFTGRACARGHVAERYTSSATCVECGKINSKEYSLAHPEQWSEWAAKNPEKVRAQRASWRAKNRAHKRKMNDKWAKANPEKVRASRSAWDARNAEKKRIYRREWLKKNADILRYRQAARYAKKRNATPLWANQLAIKAIYHLASRWADVTGVPMDVDHLVPLNNPAVCGLHCQNNLRVISASANRRKQNKLIPGIGFANDG